MFDTSEEAGAAKPGLVICEVGWDSGCPIAGIGGVGSGNAWKSCAGAVGLEFSMVRGSFGQYGTRVGPDELLDPGLSETVADPAGTKVGVGEAPNL
jgi:hypothetical protein